MKPRYLALVALALPGAAVAQTDAMQAARVMAANQVGVMEYCQAKGWADQAATDAQKASLSGLPPSPDTTGLAAAEATGKSGSLLNNGTPMALSAMASQTRTTEQALCGKMADSAKMMAQQQAAMPQMTGMPAMPAMPSGTSLPSMPQMPANLGTPKPQ